MKTILEHREEYGKLIEQSKIFQNDKANYTDEDIDNGVFTDEALTAFDALTKSITAKGKHIDALELAERQVAPEDAATDASTRAVSPVAPTISPAVGATVKPKDGGFANCGEFARCVMLASRPGAQADARLQLEVSGAAAGTFGNEASGADGGFLVPEQFSTEIMQHMLEQDSFLPLTDTTPVSGNTMSFPKDETTPWGTDGIRSFWTGEAAQITETKPLFGKTRLELNKLTALVPITDELLSDTVALESYIAKKIGQSIRWKVNDAIINGTGAGQPYGLFVSDVLVSVVKEVSQVANTIVAENVGKMFGRIPGDGISRAVWIINNDAYNQILVLTVGNQPIWTPPLAGLKSAPAGNLLGRPIMISQTCQTLGTKGDILLVDFGGYNTIQKAGGVQTDTSIHLYFDYAEVAFRAIFRLDGRPWATSSITPNNGSSNLSPFVSLDTRA